MLVTQGGTSPAEIAAKSSCKGHSQQRPQPAYVAAVQGHPQLFEEILRLNALEEFLLLGMDPGARPATARRWCC